MTAAPNRAERRKAAKAAKKRPPGARMPLMDALTEAARQHELGNLAVAESLYRSVLQAAPENVDALQLLGVLKHQNGESEEGMKLLERARARAPENPEIQANYAAVLSQSGRGAEAEESLHRALALAPTHLQARVNLIRLLAETGRGGAALEVCREGLAVAPGEALLHKFLGELLLKARDIEGAAAALRDCLELAPDDAAAMNDLAICCRELGNPVEAESLYREAVARAPDMLQIRYNFGAFLLSQGRIDEAREHLDKVLADKPDHWMTLTILALNLIKMGHEREAIDTLHNIAAAHPDEAPVWNDIGAQFMEIGKYEEATAMFARAAALDPERVEPQTNLGNAYMKQGMGYDAIREYEKALKIQPRHLEAHVALCRVLKEVYRLDEANIYAHATIILNAFAPRFFSNPLQVFRSTCDFEGLAELGDVWDILDKIQPVDVVTAMLQLLVYAEDEETARRLAAHARRWGEQIEAQAAGSPLPPRPRAGANPKLRIGILSSDLRHHSVSRFVLPLVQKYDRDRFEVFCYCPVRIDNDKIQAEFKAAADKFTFVNNFTDREVAETIRNDDIDILLELNGFTHGTRLAAIAYRPAPVQVAWLGYPFTNALEAMDYVLVDEFLKPVGDGALIEQPLVMPGSWICFGEGINFDPIKIAPEPPAAGNGVITFGTLNNTYKYTPRVFALWAEAMRAVPDSRFLVVRPECGSLIACRNIANAFVANGISPDRLYFINNRGKGLSHLAYYNEIDIALDTFPVTGGTTTVEAAWMGVPTVSLVGKAIHQRVSYAILKHCGLGECCAGTPEEFVATAAALADVEKLRALRRDMRPRLQTSTLARPDLFIENFQATMTELARRHGLR